MMSIKREELEGREFDWFAVDSNGRYGMFSTAGQGSIPETVLMNFEEHDLLSGGIDSPNKGTSSVWKGFATVGLYVFNWQLHDGPYRLECRPLGNIADGLRTSLNSISNLPKLDVNFEETVLQHFVKMLPKKRSILE